MAASDTPQIRKLTALIYSLATGGSAALRDHIEDLDNPHATTKTHVGLANVPNVDCTDAANISSGVLADARVQESNVTQHVAALNHDALLNFVANEHIDWTIDAVTVDVHDANISQSSVTQHVAALDHDALLNFVANEHLTPGVGLAASGSTITLDFVSLTNHPGTLAADDVIAVFDAAPGADYRKVAFSQLEGDLSHDALGDFVANEHVDHSGVSVTTAATSGLSGGGDLTATRTLKVDMDQSAAAASISTDRVLTETIGGVLQHEDKSSFLSDVVGAATQVNAGTGLSGGGSLSSSVTLDLDVTGLTLGLDADDADHIAIYDSTAAAHRKQTRSVFLSGRLKSDGSEIISCSADTPVLADEVYFSDGGAHINKVTLEALHRVWSGTSFPGSPSDGDLFFRTDLDCWFFYDSTNTVWLSTSTYTFGFGDARASLNNAYIRMGGDADGGGNNGYLIPFDMAIVRITASWNTSATTGNFRIRRDGTNIASLDVSTGSGIVADSGAIYAAFAKWTGSGSNGRMACYLDTMSAAISDPLVTVICRQKA